MFRCTASYEPKGTLDLPDRLTTLGTDALLNTAAGCVTVPDGLTEASLAALPADKVWLCRDDSAAAAYAEANGITHRAE